MQEKMEELILNGRQKVIEKRQKEIAPKLKEIINKYEKLIEQNKSLFDEYHNSFSSDKTLQQIPAIIKFFSDEINKLEFNEYDLELIIDDKKGLSLADYIINNKPYLSLNYFSIGGSNAELGYRFLKKKLLGNDKEYIKYLSLIGFKGSPELFLKEINGKKVIDYFIDNYELYKMCDFKVNDYLTKQYIIDNIGRYISEDKLYQALDMINFSVNDLISDINVNGKLTNVVEIYLNNDILKDSNKLNNVVIPNQILLNLIYKYVDSDNITLKQELKKCINSLYVDDEILNTINKNLIDYLSSEGIYLRKQELVNDSNDDMLFYNVIKKLESILKTGIPTSQEMIDYVKNNYLNMYKHNQSIALKEIQTLILIKQNNPKFHIEDSNVGPNFDDDTLHLVISDKENLGWHKEDNYATFNHEMTHAIQYYCFNDDTPRDFYKLLPNIQTLVKPVANYCISLIGKMKNDIKDTNEEREKVISNISLNKYSYDREVVDIFDSIMCFTDTLMQLEYPDADLIEGHPYDYMKYGGYDFSEILADYKSIWCSNREDLYDFIKNNLGVECSSFIESFYENILDDYISLYKKSDNKMLYGKIK